MPEVLLGVAQVMIGLTIICCPFMQVGGVRGAVGASSVQTIQVSTAGGVQTIKVALPPGAQTITKVNPQALAKVPTSSITKVSWECVKVLNHHCSCIF